LYDRAPVGYATLDVHGTILEINLTAATLLGTERERLLSVPFAVVARVQDMGAFFSHLDWAERQGNSMADIDITVHNGGKRVLQLTTKPNTSADGKLRGFRTTMIDVTEQRRAEADRALLAA